MPCGGQQTSSLVHFCHRVKILTRRHLCENPKFFYFKPFLYGVRTLSGALHRLTCIMDHAASGNLCSMTRNEAPIDSHLQIFPITSHRRLQCELPPILHSQLPHCGIDRNRRSRGRRSTLISGPRLTTSVIRWEMSEEQARFQCCA